LTKQRIEEKTYGNKGQSAIQQIGNDRLSSALTVDVGYTLLVKLLKNTKPKPTNSIK
jgi:hypothetical protein